MILKLLKKTKMVQVQAMMKKSIKKTPICISVSRNNHCCCKKEKEKSYSNEILLPNTNNLFRVIKKVYINLYTDTYILLIKAL